MLAVLVVPPRFLATSLPGVDCYLTFSDLLLYQIYCSSALSLYGTFPRKVGFIDKIVERGVANATTVQPKPQHNVYG